MAGDRGSGALQRLRDRVIDAGQCTNCGACAGTCPYLRPLGNRIVSLHACTLETGHCTVACPQLAAGPERDDAIPVSPLDRVLTAHCAKAVDPDDRTGAQNGGVVTALLAFGLKSGRLDGVLAVGGSPSAPTYGIARSPAEIRAMAGSKFSVFPTLAETHRIPDLSRLAIVVLPCQAEALRGVTTRRSTKPLVIGLKCNGALDSRVLQQRLRSHRAAAAPIRLDRGSSPGSFEIRRADGDTTPMDRFDGTAMTMPACAGCSDLLAEASDLMVGHDDADTSGNVVLTWTGAGQAFWDAAVTAGRVKPRPLTELGLARLRREAHAKRQRAARHSTGPRHLDADNGSALWADVPG